VSYILKLPSNVALGVTVRENSSVISNLYDGRVLQINEYNHGMHQDTNKVVISNIEPKLTLKMVGEKNFRKSYVSRIENIESTIAAFTLYLVLKPGTFPYINKNYYHTTYYILFGPLNIPAFLLYLLLVFCYYLFLAL